MSKKSFTDIASPEIIAQTPKPYKNYVRLYFRPRTPTQYSNEGIRTVIDRVLSGAHCPIPVYLLFDSIDIITRKGTKFTNGNLSSRNVEVGDTFVFISNLPFNKIYHLGTIINQDDIREITFHKNAEVICQNCRDHVNAPSECYNGEAEDEGYVGRKFSCKDFIRRK